MIRARPPELLQLRDPVLRAHVLRSSKRYWAIRVRWERATFAVRRLIYNLLVGARQGTESLSLFGQVVRAVVRPAALALVLTQVLGLTERLLLHLFPRLVPLFEAYTPDRGLYSTFLSTTAQIAGVFLGLYFTTLSLVASTSYKDVPREVRAAVLAEKVGSIYLQAVALLCAVALMLLAALSVHAGWSAGLLNFVALIGLSVTAVFSFVVLGKRAFEFFDPATLTAHVTQDFLVAMRSATTRGLHHRDRSFQAGYQKQAARALDTLHATTRLCADGDQAGSASTLAACKAALLVVRAYLALKADIPLDSFWFRRTHKHPSWLTADSSALEMAVQTQTVIHPKEEPDRVWVETSVLDLTVFAMRSLIEKGELARVAEASEGANEALSALVAHFEIDQALRYHAEFSGLALLVAQAKAATEADERARWVGVRALMYGPVTIATVVAVRSEQLNADMIRRLARSVSEGQTSVVPEVPVPTEVRDMLAWLAQTLRFERAAEGRTVTPAWFVAYAIAGAFVQFFAGALMPAVRAVNETYVPGARLLLQQGRAREAATVIQVGLEAVHRVQVHTETLTRCRAELLAFDRGVEEVKYPEIDVDVVSAASTECIRDLHRLLAQAAPKLAMEKASAERPDEFGHAYTTLGNACIEAIAESDGDLFEAIFPGFFLLSVVSRDRISDELSRHDGRTRAVFMSDPLLDVLDVSGYATLRGRLGAPRFEQVVSTKWKSLLEASGPDFANLVMLVVGHRHAHMAISPRSVVRTGWKRVVSHQLVAEGWMESDFTHRKARQQPLDAAARDFLKQGSWANVGDHFAATELLPLKEFQGVDRPRGIQEDPLVRPARVGEARSKMKSRQSRGRLKRSSLPFIPTGREPFGSDGLNLHMLCEDVALYLLPISRRRGNGISVRLEPKNDDVDDLVVNAFSGRDYHHELTEVVSDWMNQAARELIKYGLAPYELARVTEQEGDDEEKVVGFRVMGLEPSEVIEDGTRVVQRTMRRDDRGRPLDGQVEERVIPAEFVVVCRLPPELERARTKSLSALQTLDSMRTSELMLDGLKGGGPPIDFGEIQRAEKEAVAAATRRFGWHARDPRPYNGFHLTYRQLQFERFLCELRRVLIGFAQEVITKAGRMLNFEALLVVEGLPMVEDIERAEAELAEGKRPFGDIMKSVRGS